MSMKKISLLAVTFACSLLFILACTPPANIVTHPADNVTVKPPVQGNFALKIQNGEIAPDFTLNDINGNVVNLNKLRGQKVVLNLWWLKCHGCTEELLLFQEFYDKYKGQGAILIAVNSFEPELTVKTYVEEKGYTYTIISDSTKQLHQAYTNWGYPTTFFIDKEGVVQARKDAGFASLQEIEEMYNAF
jgi:peroxiredoxin